MPVVLPDIEFARIRPYGQPASRADAFEELTSILIQQRTEWPSGTRFERFGNPDGGREGKGTLPSGDVWAWQAKYLFKLDSSAVTQVTKSLVRALEQEPNLTRYFVIFPMDLPAGDNARSTSAYSLWKQALSKWWSLVEDQGRTIEFVFVGGHELTSALTEQENAGRLRYWFDSRSLTLDSQRNRIEEVIAKVGRRYSPEMHIEVDTVQVLDALGRNPTYVDRWRQVLAQLRSSRRWRWKAPDARRDIFENDLQQSQERMERADEAISRVISSVHTFERLEKASSEINSAFDAVSTVNELLNEHLRSDDGLFVGEAASLFTNARDALNALSSADQLSSAVDTRAADEGELLIIGGAGVGKTHLLCDVARRRIAEGRPTMMLLGQDFDGRPLLPQIPELIEERGTVDDVLMLLDAAAEASGNKALLIVDAINESLRPDRWLDDIRVLRTKLKRFPRVGLVLSCRTDFLDPVIGKTDMPVVEHYGFQEKTDVAVHRFAEEYELEIPSFPIFNPEFGNPLFLRLACEALYTLGESRFTLGSVGLTTVCNAFIDAMNLRLSSPARCDYDPQLKLVQAVVRELAQIDASTFERSHVNRIISGLHDERIWSQSLLKGLLDEGVLIEVSVDRLAFGYQRLGDVARASAIASKTPSEVESWLRSLGPDPWHERGTLAVLAIMLPEKHAVELFDLMSVDGSVSVAAIHSFLDSLTLRESEFVSFRTRELVERLMNTEEFADETRTQLISLACVPGHPLNAKWLHTHLLQQTLENRDATWSVWLIHALDPGVQNPVRTLIEWAWPMRAEGRGSPGRETRTLALLTLGWFLTTSDRRVRDHATKAIVALGEQDSSAFIEVLSFLSDTNDPYIIERMAAASCGISLRNASTTTLHGLAKTLADLVAEGWPQHLLTRDYIRRVLEAAREAGWDGPSGGPPYGSLLPAEPTPREEIEALSEGHGRDYSSVWLSISEMGDFGAYVLKPAIRELAIPDQDTMLDFAERAIFDRVLDLGWSPDKFGAIDSRLRRWRMGGQAERIGKKYQWIALYEVLGALTDNFDIQPSWSQQSALPYSYCEQIISRDIDVTLLARKPAERSESKQSLWFSPAQATFPAVVVNDYPSDMNGVPDPLELISVTGPDGEQWLNLLSYPDWRQKHVPEIEAQRPPTRTIWMHIHAYLVPIESAGALKAWAVGKDWYGRWMPESGESVNALLGGHHSDPQWAHSSGVLDHWCPSVQGPQPADLIQCSAAYEGTGSDRDASAEQETQGFVPSGALAGILELYPGKDFEWEDSSGVAVFDPSIREGGPNSLLVRRSQISKLEDEGYTIFWTVLAGHEHIPGIYRSYTDDHRFVSGSASYILENGTVGKVDSRAYSFSPGLRDQRTLSWNAGFLEASSAEPNVSAQSMDSFRNRSYQHGSDASTCDLEQQASVSTKNGAALWIALKSGAKNAQELSDATQLAIHQVRYGMGHLVDAGLVQRILGAGSHRVSYSIR